MQWRRSITGGFFCFVLYSTRCVIQDMQIMYLVFLDNGCLRDELYFEKEKYSKINGNIFYYDSICTSNFC